MLLDPQDAKRAIGPSPSSLVGSVLLHATLIGWMFFGPSGRGRPAEPPRNIYQQLIEPNEKKLVWYSFRDKLPQVSPLERHGISRPPRTGQKTDRQTIVATPKQAAKSKQMVYLPAPPADLDREVPAPNLFAFAVPKLPPPPPRPAAKLFAPPPEVMRQIAPPEPLPDAPDVAAAMAKAELPEAAALPRPQPKEFVAPRQTRSDPVPPPAVPDAPKVPPTSAKLDLPRPGVLPRPQPKKFVPPETKRPSAPAASIPESPRIAEKPVTPDLPRPGNLPRPQRKTFVPPREAKRVAQPAPAVPDPPQVTTATAKLTLPPPEALPKPQPKPFVPPREARRAPGPAPTFPDAPRVGPTTARVDLPQSGAVPKPQPKPFVPPREARRAPGPVPSMGDAPKVGPSTVRVDLPQTGALPKPPPREFTPPPGSKPSPGLPAPLPDAPQLAGAGGPAAPRRSFVQPADPPRSSPPMPDVAPAPALDASATSGDLTAAIVGLKPADRLTELPDAAHSAQFASGPKRVEDGGKGEPVETAKIFVPDLMIRDGAVSAPDATLVKQIVKAAAAPTSAENLAQASRTLPVLRSEARLPGVAQVPNAPDPRLTGRIIYMVAIQMPNVTSYIGSWTMWFADREPMPGQVREMRPPIPTHKVDPKYVASAAAERVEGKIQLSAVIRRDGRVESIAVLQHLDDRLDFSATQALQKWEFEPARRDGHPVDVDAIFEIPFRLEPLATK